MENGEELGNEGQMLRKKRLMMMVMMGLRGDEGESISDGRVEENWGWSREKGKWEWST
jgi:hypothetical protein